MEARGITVTTTRRRRKEGYVKILLPGRKNRKETVKQQRRGSARFTPVDKPRRMETGLPVYKSYDDFTDMKHGQQKVDSKGRVWGRMGNQEEVSVRLLVHFNAQLCIPVVQ